MALNNWVGHFGCNLFCKGSVLSLFLRCDRFKGGSLEVLYGTRSLNLTGQHVLLL